MAGMWQRARNLNRKLFPQFESLKQGRLSKIFDMYRDYTQALKDTLDVVREKPVRVGFYATCIGISVYCNMNNLDFDNYREALLDASNRHSLISDLIRNKDSVNEIKGLMKCLAEERLRRINFGLFSLIVTDEYPKRNDLFEKHCNVIQARWIHLDDWKYQIKDVGFLQRWFMLEKIMVDYDINEDEFI